MVHLCMVHSGVYNLAARFSPHRGMPAPGRGSVQRVAAVSLGVFAGLLLLLQLLSANWTAPKRPDGVAPNAAAGAQPHRHRQIVRATSVGRNAELCALDAQSIDAPPGDAECDALIGGGDECAARKWQAAVFAPALDDTMLARADCDVVTGRTGIQHYKPSPQEQSLPIAYSILAHKDVAHVAALLELIYSPNNLYCIHVDAKSVGLEKKMRRYAGCFPNVFVANKSETVYWAGFPILRATLNCMEELAERSGEWQYFINLSAQDFPLMTNKEIVKILSSLDGGNMMEMIDDKRFQRRYKYHHEVLYNRFGHPDGNRLTDVTKRPEIDALRIWKSNIAVMLHRAFVDFALRSAPASDLLSWLRDTDMPDEHYFATLAANAQIHLADVDPRHYAVAEKYRARYTLWRGSNNAQAPCHGKYIRDVCVFGVGDLPALTSSGFAFANKLHMAYQPAAYYCLRSWLLKRKLFGQ